MGKFRKTDIQRNRQTQKQTDRQKKRDRENKSEQNRALVPQQPEGQHQSWLLFACLLYSLCFTCFTCSAQSRQQPCRTTSTLMLRHTLTRPTSRLLSARIKTTALWCSKTYCVLHFSLISAVQSLIWLQWILRAFCCSNCTLRVVKLHLLLLKWLQSCKCVQLYLVSTSPTWALESISSRGHPSLPPTALTTRYIIQQRE